MNDPWKKYADENRNQFDVDVPSEKVWETINQKVLTNNRSNQWMWKAAAIVLLFSTGLLSYLLWNQNSSDELPSLGNLSGPYATMERDYQEAISQLTSQLESEKFDATEFNWIFEELKNLDEINIKYRRDLEKGQINDKLIAALIDHYEKKLKLLKKLELEINRKKHEIAINNLHTKKS